MPFLILDSLSAYYDTQHGKVHAMQDVSLSIDSGESIGIAGESACGKSTLGLSVMRSILGGKIASGRILFDGESILDITEDEFDRRYRWKKISMVFQGAMNSLDPVYTIEQQFSDILKQHHYTQNHKEVMLDAVRLVNLNQDALKKYPHELSGGMKQRVVIAMALLLRPKLVIADEPTTALDVLVQSQILQLFKNLKKQGMSFVLISHDLATISEVCDKIAIMYAGKVVEFGNLSEVLKHPQHPYTQALLKSVPKLGSGERPKSIPGTPPSLLHPEPGCRFVDRCAHAMDKCKKDPNTTRTQSGYVQCFLYE